MKKLQEQLQVMQAMMNELAVQIQGSEPTKKATKTEAVKPEKPLFKQTEKVGKKTVNTLYSRTKCIEYVNSIITKDGKLKSGTLVLYRGDAYNKNRSRAEIKTSEKVDVASIDKTLMQSVHITADSITAYGIPADVLADVIK